MADELVKMQDQFSGLDMGALIGGPLKKRHLILSSMWVCPT